MRMSSIFKGGHLEESKAHKSHHFRQVNLKKTPRFIYNRT
jgi:hypothetical protein